MADKVDSKELKSEAKETAKDAESNNAEPDSKQDEKNGQNEEEEESSEGEEHTGLYDKPVVVEGKRARKSTEFLVNQNPPTFNKETKPLFFEGKGESLGSIERTNYEIGRCNAGELKPLHKLLYGRDGRVLEIKKNIRKFNGFAFEKDSKEYESKKLGVERFTNDGLKRLCEIFDLEKKGNRSDLLEKVMDFLMSPKSSGRPAPQPKAKKAEKKKRKRTKKDSSKSKTPSSKSKKTSETVESGDDADEEDEEDEVEEEEPPKKKKKVETTPKKVESSPKKAKEKQVKEKGKDKEKSKEKTKSKKTGEKAKSPKKRDPVPVKITALKKASPKKKTPKKEKPAPVEDSSSDEEPLAKKSKKQPPTNSELEKIVKDLLDGADLEQVTMKSVCKQVYDMFPEHDLTSRKDFIKETVRKVIS
ncbi:hypothetical protein ACROYT_G008899 [Oculina patagonica]